MMYPVSHPILPLFPTRESSGFLFLAYCTLLLRKKIPCCSFIYKIFLKKQTIIPPKYQKFLVFFP